MRQRNNEMNHFVYGAAHDLKAPLRTIIQISGHILRDLEPQMNTSQKESVDLLRQRADRMNRLIDDLLAYWQADQSRTYECNFAITAYELIDDVLCLIDAVDGCVIVDESLKNVEIMRSPMHQIMLNLIGNAIKHSQKENLKIRIEVEDAGECYRFFVADNGCGIADQYKEKVFEPFETLRSQDDVEGSGLGLSLVERVVQRHKGHISATDTPGGGATFVLMWPKKQTF